MREELFLSISVFSLHILALHCACTHTGDLALEHTRDMMLAAHGDEWNNHSSYTSGDGDDITEGGQEGEGVDHRSSSTPFSPSSSSSSSSLRNESSSRVRSIPVGIKGFPSLLVVRHLSQFPRLHFTQMRNPETVAAAVGADRKISVHR